MQSVLVSEQMIEAEQTSKLQEHLELMQMKEDVLVSVLKVLVSVPVLCTQEDEENDEDEEEEENEVLPPPPGLPAPGIWAKKELVFRPAPGLEDQFNQWLPLDGMYVAKALEQDHLNMMKITEDLTKITEEDTTSGSGSDGEDDGDSSEDERPSQLKATAPEFFFTPVEEFSVNAPVFIPPQQLSATAPAFIFVPPSPQRTGLQSCAKLFVPGAAKTKLSFEAQLFVPKTASPEPVAAVKAKTSLLGVRGSAELFVPAWPELGASVDMKTKKKR